MCVVRKFTYFSNLSAQLFLICLRKINNKKVTGTSNQILLFISVFFNETSEINRHLPRYYSMRSTISDSKCCNAENLKVTQSFSKKQRPPVPPPPVSLAKKTINTESSKKKNCLC